MTANTRFKGSDLTERGRTETTASPNLTLRRTAASRNVNYRQAPNSSQCNQPVANFGEKSAEEVRNAVHAVFFASGYAALYFVNCQVVGRQLVLSGKVPSYHLKQLAQVLALRVDGIEQIENSLEVSRRF